MPIAHGEGRYYVDPGSVPELNVAFRYRDNPNGSVDRIAGVVSQRGNVLGLMPHPEHAVEPLTGSADGLKLFLSAARAPLPGPRRLVTGFAS